MLWNAIVNAEIEPAQIFIEKGFWIDESRSNRAVPYKIYSPEPSLDERLPVVIWSHGLGGSRDGAGFISRYVASHGYVVIHIQHKGTDSSLWEGKPGHPWDIIRDMHIPRSATLERLRDVPFVIDRIAAMNKPQFDMQRLGFSGHSFGAMTTQVMAGQYRSFGDRRYSLYEPRIKAGILYSPGPAKHKENYAGIRIPILAMTGTEDDSPLGEFTADQRQDVFRYSATDEQHLVVLDGGDHMVFNGSRGKLGVNPKREVHERIIRVLSLAFWDAYLKGDQAAKDWLTGDGVRAWLGSEAVYSYKASTGT